ncbi:hypothetical protein IHN63_00745 [Deinococcus sp. 6YEL10]|uniref:hypothetical protein n=1 Tax=Deinococcus sp. 6YEL10 TaxID=2745870 RepID=UPI001E3D7107|nr:hypothetical protein [Deinococcus sp. 6YEL10]MCD0159825.1 hypothetical protein [Deinococcus sp. 6YEL10]
MTHPTETAARILENIAFSIMDRSGDSTARKAIIPTTNAARLQVALGQTGADQIKQAKGYLTDYLTEQRTRRRAPTDTRYGLPLDIPDADLTATAARYGFKPKHDPILYTFTARYKGETYTYNLNSYDQPDVWELYAVGNRQTPAHANRYWRRVQMATHEKHGNAY